MHTEWNWYYRNGFSSFINTNKIKVHISLYQKMGKIFNPQVVLFFFCVCTVQEHWTCFSSITTSFWLISILRFWVDFDDTCKRYCRVCGWSIYSEYMCVQAHTLNGNCSSHKAGRGQILSLQLPWKLTQSCKGEFTYQDWLCDLIFLPIPKAVNALWCCR